MDKLTSLQRSVLVIAWIGMEALWLSRISGTAITMDAGQTLRMAINLQRADIVSLEEQPPFHPSMYREPLPVLTTAFGISAVDALMGRAAADQYFSGDRAKYLKYQNLLWAGLLWIAVFFSTRHFTGAFLLPLAAAFFAVNPFDAGSTIVGVNSLFTELPAAALLAFSGLTLLKAARDGRAAYFLATGLVFGLLTLTKAAFLYVAIGLALVIAPLYIFFGARGSRAARAMSASLVIAAAAVIVTPWLYRNAVDFEKVQVAERGGVILYTRALLNRMSSDEYRGAFYVWAPPNLRSLVGSALGFSTADLKKGGRLQRLNDAPNSGFYDEDRTAEFVGKPEATVTIYRNVRAERVRLTNQFAKEGQPYPMTMADHVLQERGMQMISSDIGADIAMTFPLIWRAAPILYSFLLFVLVYCVITRRFALALFVAPALALLTLNALASIFISRYAVAALPAAAVASAVIAHTVWSSRARLTFLSSWMPRGFSEAEQ